MPSRQPWLWQRAKCHIWGLRCPSVPLHFFPYPSRYGSGRKFPLFFSLGLEVHLAAVWIYSPKPGAAPGSPRVPAACLGEGWEQHTTPGFVPLRLLVLVPVPALPVFKDPVYCLGSKYPRKGGGWEETERKVNSVI